MCELLTGAKAKLSFTVRLTLTLGQQEGEDVLCTSLEHHVLKINVFSSRFTILW